MNFPDDISEDIINIVLNYDSIFWKFSLLYSNAIQVWLIILILLNIFDFMLWSFNANKEWILKSCIWINWIKKKLINVFWILIIIIICGFIQWVLLESNSILWIIPLLLIILFSIAEFYSILENLALIYSNSTTWKIYNIAIFIFKRLFNLTENKIKEIANNKLFKDNLNNNNIENEKEKSNNNS